jgi:hypothetical protein
MTQEQEHQLASSVLQATPDIDSMLRIQLKLWLTTMRVLSLDAMYEAIKPLIIKLATILAI